MSVRAVVRAATPGTLLLVIGVITGCGESDGVNRQRETTIDTTTQLSQAELTRMLDDPLACRSPGVVSGFVRNPPRTVAHGTATFLADERLVFYDNATHQLRVFSAGGLELARLGRRGSGPGEFSMSPAVKRWLADTIATYEAGSRRLSLFTEAGFVRQVQLPEVRHGLFLGLLGDGWMMFLSSQPEERTGRIRAALSVSRVREGRAAFEVVRDSIPATEVFIDRGPGAVSSRAPAFPYQTSIVALDRFVAVYDDSTDRIDFLASDGTLARSVHVAIRAPSVSRRTRDSVNSAYRRRGAGLPAPSREQFSAVRGHVAPIDHVLADAEGGLWLRLHESVSPGGGVYLRLAMDGYIDRCFRPPPATPFDPRPPRGVRSSRFLPRQDGRIIAFARDRVAIALVGEDEDTVRVLRTAYVSR